MMDWKWLEGVVSNLGWLKIFSYIGPITSYVTIGLLLTLVSWWRWRSKIDNESIIVSLNTPLYGENGTPVPKSLRMYTLLNCRLREVIENRYAQKTLLKAAGKTTEKNPFIPLGKNKMDILTLLLNDISSIFAPWFVAKDLGVPVKSEKYVLALTRERYPGMRFETTRVMLVKASWLLETDFSIVLRGEESDWNLQYPHHSWRIETLRKMKADYLLDCYHPSEYCITMEICVPAGAECNITK